MGILRGCYPDYPGCVAAAGVFDFGIHTDKLKHPSVIDVFMYKTPSIRPTEHVQTELSGGFWARKIGV